MSRYLCILLLLATPAWSDITGEVVRVLDGDTIIVREGAEFHKVRLTGIDAPESKQTYGRKATGYLRSWIKGKTVKVRGSKTDRYGRLLGKVVYQDRDINLQMVQEGHAWWYRRYKGSQSWSDRRAYDIAETLAREAEKGLWGGSSVPPWEFRQK